MMLKRQRSVVDRTTVAQSIREKEVQGRKAEAESPPSPLSARVRAVSPAAGFMRGTEASRAKSVSPSPRHTPRTPRRRPMRAVSARAVLPRSPGMAAPVGASPAHERPIPWSARGREADKQVG